MAPEMGNKKAAGPAETPHIVASSVGMDVKPSRIGELKVKFAGVTKALRSALAEMAGRFPGGPRVQTNAAKHNMTLSW